MHQIALTAYGSPKYDVGAGPEYLQCSGHPHQRTAMDMPLGMKSLSRPLWRSF